MISISFISFLSNQIENEEHKQSIKTNKKNEEQNNWMQET